MNTQNIIKIWIYLKGKKTHIIAGTMILTSLANLVFGDITVLEFLNSESVTLLFQGTGLSTLRAGIQKVQDALGKK